ncbi:hypothetical protein DN550_31865, partial [Burkholderia multivorans]
VWRSSTTGRSPEHAADSGAELIRLFLIGQVRSYSDLMRANAEVTVRPAESADEARWRELFRDYRELYHPPESEDVVARPWGWVSDPSHESESLVAEADGQI